MKCPKCTKTFHQTETLRRHIRLFHGIRDGEVIVCTENNCYQIFMKVYNFIRYCKNYHNISSIHEQSRVISTHNLTTNDLRADTVDSFTVSDTIQSYNNNDNMSECTIERVENATAQHCS